MKIRIFAGLCFCIILYNCSSKEKEVITDLIPDSSLKFITRNKQETNISFANVVRESKNLNYFTFPYIYAGGGVATGDVDNDGLPDIFFIGNNVKNRLYLNKGNLKFEDISVKAGVQGDDKLRWATGVTMADVNADGLLDIYVCISGLSPDRQNLLYINNGDLTFTESAKEYGLNDEGYSNQATFFDYDNDGDLDMYLASYPPCDFQSTNAFYAEKMNTATDDESDQLYENIGEGKFINATGKAGVFNFGLTLNASVSDFNNDGWYDIYVSNDFNSPDFLYINQKNGSFKNEIKTLMNHTANFGMGSDAADFNNDGLIDLIQADMMSSSNFGQKRNMPSMNPEYFKEAVDLGLHHQYMRNCLQMNNGNGSFSDIAELAKISSTDWSWSTLFADLNNDGWKDIFVTNGMRRSVNNKDFSNYANKMIASGRVMKGEEYLLEKKMPVEPVTNKVFVNNGDLSFSPVVDKDGLSYYGFTHGAAYADLDLDGDLDMVINNIDKNAQVVENQSNDNNYIRLKLLGTKENKFGIGGKIKLISGSHIQYQELIPSRGYLSSVEPVLHFGVGKIKTIDSILITWPGNKQQLLTDIEVNQILEIHEKDASSLNLDINNTNDQPLFTETKTTGINFIHKENSFDDFEKQVLLPHQLSRFGPAMTKGDINGDGLEDIFFGGAADQSASLFFQNTKGSFEKQAVTLFETDKNYEDTAALMFDADNDGDLDLYVASGGNEFIKDSKYYNDRLYLNNGLGILSKSSTMIPDIRISASQVRSFDYDKDGDLDILVTGRLIPWEYPKPASSILLENKGGKFIDVTMKIAPDLKDIGLVTDVICSDYNKDGKEDIVLVGEWMPITILEQKNNTFQKKEIPSLKDTEGWWYSIEASDFDNDGDMDYIVGNLGLNYKYKASNSEPFEVYYGDFDDNGTNDLALGYYENNTLFPVRGKQCSTEQIPTLKEKFTSYEAFAKASFYEVYNIKKTKNLLHLKTKTFASALLINSANESFVIQQLPNLAQVSSINDMIIKDFDKDGVKDIIVAGNLFTSEVETPRNDAGVGMFLKGKLEKGQYSVIPVPNSGLKLNKDLKRLQYISTQTQDGLLISANNNDAVQVYQLKN